MTGTHEVSDMITIEIFEFGFFGGVWTISYADMEQVIAVCADLGLEIWIVS